MLNASKFLKSKDIYTDEFFNLLTLIVSCYTEIREKEVFAADQFETFLRNVLVKKYLRIKKNDFQLGYLSFEIESGEIEDNYRTIGFLDIKVSNLGHKMLLNEDEYYSFECKRLDGKNELNKKYVNNGIIRYIVGKYSSSMSIAGMIGFVQNGSISEIVKSINEKIIENNSISSTSLLEEFTEISNNCIFKSCHNRERPLPCINIYHLMFDYT